MLGLLKNILGNHNEKTIRRHSETVQRINAIEPDMRRLADAELAAQTARFRERLARGETLEQILPEAFATVREASRRVLGLRHFDVQLIGGMVLHEGNIAEMKTGEGKTLVATLPLYLNALPGHGAHLVTVNDYLARRDAEWMGRIYRFLGMDVGLIVHGLDHGQRRRSYAADITYGTNNEFGFDYLRDNMVLHPTELVQRPLHFAVVDEVDSILVDEARTPLIISGPAEKPTDLYYKFTKIADRLEEGVDYTVDEKARTVAPTEDGVHKVERMLNVPHLYADEKTDYAHYLNNALKAKALFKLDRDYVVKDGQVIIVDEFTGRLMFGRRWSDGLHQAVEAKEGCKIERETVTLATITFQNFFRMYKKLSGMTGTALTEEEEFRKIYGLDVIVIPTNKPMIRKDLPDVVYKTAAAKFRAVIEEIVERHKTGQPLLVGTISIEKSEMLSALLGKRGVKHQVLNAKYHEKEAEIIAQAGRLGAVTIATNMAGRGTDILLGGNPEFLARQRLRAKGYAPDVILAATAPVVSEPPGDVRQGGSASAAAGDPGAAGGMPVGLPGAGGVAILPPTLGPNPEEVARARQDYLAALADARRETDREHDEVVKVGGLHIIGTERHESRRIDNQLRGRAGRQGDPGSSRFYVGLDDDLMRLFGGDAVARIMDRLGIEEDVPIDAGIVSRAIENAQKKVEARNFDARKHVLEYDDVMNKQREIIYSQRREVLEGADLRAKILDMVGQTIDSLLDAYCNEQVHREEWDLDGLLEQAELLFLPPAAGSGRPRLTADDLRDQGRQRLRELLLQRAEQIYAEREAQFGDEMMREIERIVTLRAVDEKWVDHLTAMDELRQGIGLRAYGQRDPLIEYKSEAYEMFQGMIRSIQEDIVRNIYHVSIVREPERRRTTEWGGGAAPAFGGAAMAGDGGLGGPVAGPGAAGGHAAAGGGSAPRQPHVAGRQIGRNDPCWCGSGKKYKKCHGASA